MSKVINISSNGIKQAIDDLVNENEMLQDKVYKLEDIIKEVREYLEIFTNFDECTINGRMLQKAIEILDKENKYEK